MEDTVEIQKNRSRRNLLLARAGQGSHVKASYVKASNLLSKQYLVDLRSSGRDGNTIEEFSRYLGDLSKHVLQQGTNKMMLNSAGHQPGSSSSSQQHASALSKLSELLGGGSRLSRSARRSTAVDSRRARRISLFDETATAAAVTAGQLWEQGGGGQQFIGGQDQELIAHEAQSSTTTTRTLDVEMLETTDEKVLEPGTTETSSRKISLSTSIKNTQPSSCPHQASNPVPVVKNKWDRLSLLDKELLHALLLSAIEHSRASDRKIDGDAESLFLNATTGGSPNSAASNLVLEQAGHQSPSNRGNTTMLSMMQLSATGSPGATTAKSFSTRPGKKGGTASPNQHGGRLRGLLTGSSPSEGLSLFTDEHNDNVLDSPTASGGAPNRSPTSPSGLGLQLARNALTNLRSAASRMKNMSEREAQLWNAQRARMRKQLRDQLFGMGQKLKFNTLLLRQFGDDVDRMVSQLSEDEKEEEEEKQRQRLLVVEEEERKHGPRIGGPHDHDKEQGRGSVRLNAAAADPLSDRDPQRTTTKTNVKFIDNVDDLVDHLDALAASPAASCESSKIKNRRKSVAFVVDEGEEVQMKYEKDEKKNEHLQPRTATTEAHQLTDTVKTSAIPPGGTSDPSGPSSPSPNKKRRKSSLKIAASGQQTATTMLTLRRPQGGGPMNFNSSKRRTSITAARAAQADPSMVELNIGGAGKLLSIKPTAGATPGADRTPSSKEIVGDEHNKKNNLPPSLVPLSNSSSSKSNAAEAGSSNMSSDALWLALQQNTPRGERKISLSEIEHVDYVMDHHAGGATRDHRHEILHPMDTNLLGVNSGKKNFHSSEDKIVKSELVDTIMRQQHLVSGASDVGPAGGGRRGSEQNIHTSARRKSRDSRNHLQLTGFSLGSEANKK
ncbi:unnamed protein product [Amoebophrya sp. A25]|nr:unnamed protein product [Amoebophrya sp. A25]|eukprot:GSA25T00018560001.1